MILTSMFLVAMQVVEPPVPPEPIAGECVKEIPINAGQPLPDALVRSDAAGGTSIARCHAVAIPLSVALDLAALEVWGEHVYKRYEIETGAMELKIILLEEEIARLSKPTPFWERPGAHIALGLAAGVGLSITSAVILQKAVSD